MEVVQQIKIWTISSSSQSQPQGTKPVIKMLIKKETWWISSYVFIIIWHFRSSVLHITFSVKLRCYSCQSAGWHQPLESNWRHRAADDARFIRLWWRDVSSLYLWRQFCPAVKVSVTLWCQIKWNEIFFLSEYEESFCLWGYSSWPVFYCSGSQPFLSCVPPEPFSQTMSTPSLICVDDSPKVVI